MLAYASLVHEGYGVRLVGQDSRRGTFAHRHAVLMDQQTGADYSPLDALKALPHSKQDGWFRAYDSLLSELGAMGFEYGYAATAPNVLTLWEAQFGDFCNVAQVIIDQFLSSGEEKWGRLCGLCLLLPHGYEGQGAEHSSARLERFLQLCANGNMLLCVPTSPAQMFHLLRRQLLHRSRKPLVVMSPKSLLRHPLAVSSVADLATGAFAPVLPDQSDVPPAQCERLLLCSGKVYFDLVAARQERAATNVAVVRLEQLYPFPDEELLAVLRPYVSLKRVLWCQEEPRNQGPWYHTRHRIERVLARVNADLKAEFVGRWSSAAPAVATQHLHTQQQSRFIAEAFAD